MQKNQYLELNQYLFKDKTVLDLACHDGISTGIIKDLGAKHVYGVEARKELVIKAEKNVIGNVNFYVGDIQDEKLIAPLIEKSDTVVALGVFYHLYNHFGLFSCILKSNIKYVLIETVSGPETLDPSMSWGFERVNNVFNGWHNTAEYVPHGTPNLSWIFQSAKLFGFSCDWVYSYGKLPPKTRYNMTLKEYMDLKQNHWPDYEKIKSNENLPDSILKDIDSKLVNDGPEHAGKKRILLRLYNEKIIDSAPIDIKDCYQWLKHKKTCEKIY